MEPQDVWVIFNKETLNVEFVYAEEFQAMRKLNWLHWSPDAAPLVRNLKNVDITVCTTLERALQEINLEYCSGIKE
jgi:hypothetical protein